MRIDKSRISGTRFMFAIAFFLQSSALLTSFLAGITMQESWIPVVAGFVVCIPLIYLYRTLMLRFPDQNYFQVLTTVYGPVVGKVIGALYLWFFFTLTTLNVGDIGDFIKLTVLPETPHVMLTLCCVLVAVWAVRNGLRVVTRYGSVFTVIEFLIVAVSIILVSNQIKLTNFLPVFAQPAAKYIQGIHITSTIPIGETVVFLMLVPCVKKLSPREATKYWFCGVAMGIAVLLAALLRDIAVLGNTIHFFSLPGLVTLRLVNLTEALSRMEIIFTIAIMMLLFFKIAVLIYVSTIATAQLFETTQFKRLALIIGIFVVAYGPTLYPSSVEHSMSAHTVEPVVWTLFEIILPLLTFLIAKIRKLPEPVPAAKGQEG
ncbi:MAG: endospore germination permease [Candidatus Limiplasma sp.]|nr:endospore germination permease [Candidatus Limiplasma sp.]